MFSDKPAKDAGLIHENSTSHDSPAPLPPSVKVYKPELHGGIMNTLTSAYRSEKNNSDKQSYSAGSESISAETPLEPVQVITETDFADTAGGTEITEPLSAGTPEPDLVLFEPESPAVTEPEPVSEETEDPIPLLFEGIGRTSWNQPDEKSVFEQTDYEYDPYTSDPYFAGGYSSDFPGYPETSEESPAEDEPDCSEPPEEDVDVFELLDFIDDIEFSGLEPEPLREVQYATDKGDPYNSAFNNPDPSSTDEPDEFSIAPSFQFEKK